MTRHARTARLIALLLPAALLAGAWGSQLWGGLYPCEMCLWQRWPHYAALIVALLAFAAPRHARAAVLLAALLIEASGVVGAVHAGVEYGWWPGFTRCTSTVTMTGTTPAERLAAIMKAPIVRCDVAQWRLAGVSLAGWNALLSLGGSLAIFLLMGRKR